MSNRGNRNRKNPKWERGARERSQPRKGASQGLEDINNLKDRIIELCRGTAESNPMGAIVLMRYATASPMQAEMTTAIGTSRGRRTRTRHRGDSARSFERPKSLRDGSSFVRS
uniref:Uncharacterized protein n=1 Tax=Candidatus Kentrum sp. TC TaxID=2126339 RepID=A0A450YMY1_9GAMM|nr:MAG: hypothetical protein BECKTC1821D_GA0114238_101411 [Candidatus Kentron sp. TC]